MKEWGGRWDSNPRRPESQSGALPTELRPPASRYSNACDHGAPGRIRTCNPRLRRPMLYPLSYGRNLIEVIWSGQQDSNLRPSAPKADALPDCAMPRAIRTPRILCAVRAVSRSGADGRDTAVISLERPGKGVRESASLRAREYPGGRQDPRRQSRRPTDPRRAQDPRRTRHASASAARPRSRSCSSATTLRRRSTYATSSRRPRKPAWASSTSVCPQRPRWPPRSQSCGASTRTQRVDGILVQSPLPKAMGADAEQQVFDAIDPSKDVDGFSPISAGRLVQNREGFAPCTPAGVIELLVRTQDSDRGQARRRDRPLRHRRQADGVAAAAQERDRHDLPLAHARSARDGAAGRHPRRGDRPPRVRDAGVRETRRGRHRRRASTASPRPKRRGAFSRRGPNASRRSSGGAPCSSETSIRTWRMSPARSRRFPAASVRLTIAMLMANTVKAAELRAR